MSTHYFSTGLGLDDDYKTRPLVLYPACFATGGWTSHRQGVQWFTEE